MMADFPSISLPMDRKTTAGLQLGDMVLLDGEIVVTAGLPTHQRLIECVRGQQDLPRSLAGTSLFHLGTQSREVPGSDLLEVLYMNPTTSTRFDAIMPELIRGFGLTAVGGKGGLDRASVQAMQETGCVYFSFVGGACPLLSDAIAEVVSVDWSDLIAHYRLVTLRVKALGPVTVAIDAHGNSIYADLSSGVTARMPGIRRNLRAER